MPFFEFRDVPAYRRNVLFGRFSFGKDEEFAVFGKRKPRTEEIRVQNVARFKIPA